MRGWLLGSTDRIGGMVYGTIVAMAVIAAGSEGTDSDTARTAALVVATTVVFWLAHVYTFTVELSVESRGRLTWSRLRGVARREASILRAAMLPTGVLLLGAFGLLGDRAAVWLALAIGTAVLGEQGFVYARVEGLGPLGTAASVAVNLLLGLSIVGLKAFVAH